MAYISSNANRFYTALEASYGQVGSITSGNRIPALKLTVQQKLDDGAAEGQDGQPDVSRPAAGRPAADEFRAADLHDELAASGGKPGIWPAVSGGTRGRAAAVRRRDARHPARLRGRLGFAAPHGLGAGQAVSCAGEIRFVAAIVDASTVQLNAPFTVLPGTGAAMGAAVTYVPATELPSASVFDYWDPATAVQRLLCGAAVDQMEIQVNGDYHEFHFSGLAQDVLDSSSFSSANVGQLQSFPAEPALAAFDYSIVPGNMGQAWLGTTPAQFLTITSASIVLKNQLDTRSKEFGSNLPRAISPGQRSVTAAFELFSQDDDATKGLYQAARQQSPISGHVSVGRCPRTGDGRVPAERDSRGAGVR